MLKSANAMAMQIAVTSLCELGSPQVEPAGVSVITVNITLRAAGVSAAVMATIAAC